MSSTIAREVLTALEGFSSRSRLYELKVDGAEDVLVEAFAADEPLNGIGWRDVVVLSARSKADLRSLLGRTSRLEVSLADGTRTNFGGIVTRVEMLGSVGGLARYRLRQSSWIWLLSQVVNSRAWQHRTVVEIVDSVFAQYQPHAAWRWSGEVGRFMADADARSYCAQYRETDFDFVSRLLAEEGLAWRFESHENIERMVLISDSSRLCAAPEDSSSAAGGGIRYHAAGALEESDSIQYLQVSRTLGPASVTVLSYDYKSKRSVCICVPTKFPVGGKHAQAVQSFDCPGQYAYRDSRQARRYAGMIMEAHEARALVWEGSSTARTMRAGSRVKITGVPLKQYRTGAEVMLVRVVSAGVNNLPIATQNGLTALFGPIAGLLTESLGAISLADFDRTLELAHKSGYANSFEAIPADRPWRPLVELGPTARGTQSAIVVGADGSDEPNGADEIYCDRLGRVRIRFHWQEDKAGCWVRVAQRSAGPRMGSQFLPRIGQEVLVKFIENDINRPIIVGALYNGQGEGGVLPTPGGKVDAVSKTEVFAKAHDHFRGGQGNLAGGHSPVWHGASEDSAGHRNAAAQWGIRTKEFGGFGYNQLVFDDTDKQGRLQLKTTHAATELNLGYLIHGVDNYRGSLRGRGAELRTDAFGVVRAGTGLLISSYAIAHSATGREPAGENTKANILLEQATKLASRFSAAASMHQTVGYAGHLGALKVNSSVIASENAPIDALRKSTKAMCDFGSDEVPHPDAAVIEIAAKAGLGIAAGQDVQLASGEIIAVMSGADTQFVSGGQMRVHSGQAVGVLAGAVATGDNDVGLQLIASKDAVELQAQADELKVQAREQVNVISANAHIDWAAAKSISLSTAGGANITISDGNITVQCPGKIAVHAGMKKFNPPAKLNYSMPLLPKSVCLECLMLAIKSGSPFAVKK